MVIGSRVQLNTHRVNEIFHEKGLKVVGLATALGRSITFARSVLEGYLPVRDPEQVVERLAAFLGVKPKDILVSEKRKTA